MTPIIKKSKFVDQDNIFKMIKVRLSREAFDQLADHPYVTEDTIIGIVKDSPLEERKYTDPDHFHITFPRKKNKKWVEVTILVHVRPQEFVVYGIHSRRLSKRKH